MMKLTTLLFAILHHQSLIHSLSITPSTQSSNIIRGSNKYGSSNNSTILTPSDAALRVGVKPTKEATKEEWQRAWKLHRSMMKPLHLGDKCRPKDSKLALACLWWKAIAGNDSSSPVHDYSLSYDLLPSVTRWVVSRRVCRLYPRLHHANVEIRTAYLDKALTNVINTIMKDHDAASTAQQNQPKKKIRLVVMGGGYDTRSIKLLEQSLLHQSADDVPRFDLLQKKHKSRRWHNRLLRRSKLNEDDNDATTGNAFLNITSNNYKLEAYELDLPEVVVAKKKLLSSRLFRRRPWLRHDQVEYPKLLEADFNDINGTRKVLEGIILDDSGKDDVTNIILFEGVMIYLDKGMPHALLELCSDVLRKSDKSDIAQSSSTTPQALGYLCFADRLENIPGGDEDAANIEMESTGWELIDFLSKPGLARHMGVSRVVR